MKGEITLDLLENDDGTTDEALTAVMANAEDREW